MQRAAESCTSRSNKRINVYRMSEDKVVRKIYEVREEENEREEDQERHGERTRKKQ